MGFEPNDVITRKTFMDGLLLKSEGNYKKEQDQGLIKRLKGELKSRRS